MRDEGYCKERSRFQLRNANRYHRAMRFSLVLLGALLISTPAWAENPSRGNPHIRFGEQSIDDMIAAYMAEHGVAGMSLAIVQAPYVTRATGHGFSDPQRKTLVSVNTMFDVADMRAAFNAVAVMQLVEQGKLERDAAARLVRQPREKVEDVIEQASGQTYQQFVRRNQLDRLGLKHTSFGSELAQVAREELKVGDRHQRFLHEHALIDPAEPALPSDGQAIDPRGIYASASDVSFWDIALAGDILIKDPALRKLLYEPSADDATTGAWFFPGRPGLMVATGSSHGFSSLLSRFTHRDELLCVTLLANRGGLDLTQLARRIAGAYNPKLGPPAKATGMRAQQSPWSVSESVARLQRVLRERELAATFGAIEVLEDNGQVWITAADPGEREARAVLDRVLLEAVTQPSPSR